MVGEVGAAVVELEAGFTVELEPPPHAASARVPAIASQSIGRRIVSTLPSR